MYAFFKGHSLTEGQESGSYGWCRLKRMSIRSPTIQVPLLYDHRNTIKNLENRGTNLEKNPIQLGAEVMCGFFNGYSRTEGHKSGSYG